MSGKHPGSDAAAGASRRVTAQTITDDQIRELGHASVADGRYCDAMWCDYALIAKGDTRFDVPRGCERNKARAHCARLINARLEAAS